MIYTNRIIPAILCFVSLIAYSTTRPISKGNYKIDKNNLIIITPYIEIKEKSGENYIIDLGKKKRLSTFVLEILEKEFPNSNYVEIPFISKDFNSIEEYLAFNKIIERGINYRYESVVPEEFRVKSSNPSIFVRISG